MKLVNERFTPVRVHIKERPNDFARFKTEWTPTVVIAEPDGTERHRFEGFLPADDFRAQLELGLARAAFSRGQFDEAQRAFRALAESYPKTEAAPEAVYWAAVSGYKATGKPDSLKQGATELKNRYPQSDWTKKSSVWAG